jgi:hypothetical protein
VIDRIVPTATTLAAAGAQAIMAAAPGYGTLLSGG